MFGDSRLLFYLTWDTSNERRRCQQRDDAKCAYCFKWSTSAWESWLFENGNWKHHVIVKAHELQVYDISLRNMFFFHSIWTLRNLMLYLPYSACIPGIILRAIYLVCVYLSVSKSVFGTFGKKNTRTPNFVSSYKTYYFDILNHGYISVYGNMNTHGVWMIILIQKWIS